MKRRGRVSPTLALCLFALCGTVAALPSTMMIPLIPDLPRLLGVSENDASWILISTLLTSAVAMPIVARMADLYGKRRMIILSLAILVSGSVICAISSSFPWLLVGRSMQGIATSLLSISISMLRDIVPRERLAGAIAIMGATVGVGSALGLPLSGILTEAFGWHSVFIFSAVAAGVLLVCLLLLVKESTVRDHGKFDLVGAILLGGALVSLLLVLTKGQAWGWTSEGVVWLSLASLVTFAVWVPLELRLPFPMVDLRRAVRRTVLLTNLASFAIGFALYTNLMVTSRILQLPKSSEWGLGLDTAAAGVALIPSAVATMFVSPLAGMMVGRRGGRVVLMTGAALMAVVFACRVYFSSSLLEVVAGASLISVGQALVLASIPHLTMSAVPVTATASSNGLNALIRNTGLSFATAMVAIVLTANTELIGGQNVASTTGLRIIFITGAAMALSALVLAAFIPRSRVNNEGHQSSRSSSLVLEVDAAIVGSTSGEEAAGGRPLSQDAARTSRAPDERRASDAMR